MNERPSPEALLQQAARESRGRLKLFLGAAPGVGKTYAMLRAAHRRKAEGAEVCVGLIETHGRVDTEAQLQGLEVLPRRTLAHRDREFTELDVDAILQRRPQLVLVDEFAHSNIPGSCHPQRHQDIDDLLDAGIDVYSTLNVQHIESLNDVVARITGVEVRETVPNAALASADEIELIDLPPEDLIQRLKEGKVYVPEQARQALHQFFGRGALTALRQLAMRVAAERVDAQLMQYKQTHGLGEVWPTRERILVCVNDTDISQVVIRAARRIAENRRIPWLAVHVETPRSRRQPVAVKERIARNLRLAERLGAQSQRLLGDDLVATLLACAKRENASQIMVGRPLASRLRWPWSRSVAGALVRGAAPLEVTVVTWTPPAGRSSRREVRLSPVMPRSWSSLKPYAAGVLIGAVITAVLTYAPVLLPVSAAPMLYLLGVVIVAARLGFWPAVFSALLYFLLFNFFFSPPLYTLTVANFSDVQSLLTFLVVALITGRLGGQLREQLEEQRASHRRAAAIAAFGARLAGATEQREVVSAVAEQLRQELAPETVLMLPDAGGRLLVQAGSTERKPLGASDQAAARWAFDKGQTSGWNTDTLPAAQWLFLPLSSGSGTLGVLGIRRGEAGESFTDVERRALEAAADLTVIALERTRLVTQLETSRVAVETEQLRAALLSSVSHDLRTPLVSVLGAAGALLERQHTLAPADRDTLLETIVEEAERLDRFVQNLLDMTRLSYGGLQLRRDWCDLRELIGQVRHRLARNLQSRPIELSLPPRLPLLRVDAVLIEQVLVNVFDNATKYSPPDSPITVAASVAYGRLRLLISDRGDGIALGEREAVFNMFHRARSGDTRVAGTGLGLLICRGFVEAHGGRIVALDGAGGPGESPGCTIEISLPLERDAPLGDDIKSVDVDSGDVETLA